MTIQEKKEQIKRMERISELVNYIAYAIVIFAFVAITIMLSYYLKLKNSIWGIVVAGGIFIIMLNVVGILWTIFAYFKDVRMDWVIKSLRDKMTIIKKYNLNPNEYVEIQRVEQNKKFDSNIKVKYYAKLILEKNKIEIEIYIKSSLSDLVLLSTTDNFGCFTVTYNPIKF